MGSPRARLRGGDGLLYLHPRLFSTIHPSSLHDLDFLTDHYKYY